MSKLLKSIDEFFSFLVKLSQNLLVFGLWIKCVLESLVLNFERSRQLD